MLKCRVASASIVQARGQTASILTILDMLACIFSLAIVVGNAPPSASAVANDSISSYWDTVTVLLNADTRLYVGGIPISRRSFLISRHAIIFNSNGRRLALPDCRKCNQDFTSCI